MWVLFYVLHESAKTASLCIPQVGEGAMRGIFFFFFFGGGRFLKLLKGKGGMVKISEGRKGGGQCF